MLYLMRISVCYNLGNVAACMEGDDINQLFKGGFVRQRFCGKLNFCKILLKLSKLLLEQNLSAM